jgi:hypothetical protein
VKPPSPAVEGLSEPLPLLQPASLYEGSGIQCHSYCRATTVTARAASLLTRLGIPPCVQPVGSGATEESESESRKKHMLRLHVVSSCRGNTWLLRTANAFGDGLTEDIVEAHKSVVDTTLGTHLLIHIYKACTDTTTLVACNSQY